MWKQGTEVINDLPFLPGYPKTSSTPPFTLSTFPIPPKTKREIPNIFQGHYL